jgi:hypothetical protein
LKYKNESAKVAAHRNIKFKVNLAFIDFLAFEKILKGFNVNNPL